MAAKGDDGTIFPNVSQALRYSDGKVWRTREEGSSISFTMSFTLKGKCPDNWEIATINFKSTNAPDVELQIDQKVKYSWVRNSTIYIAPCALVVVILYSQGSLIWDRLGPPKLFRMQ